MLLLRLSGALLLRFDDNKLSALLLFHDPPRNTRAGPARRSRSRTSLAEILKFSARAARGKREKGKRIKEQREKP